MRYMTIRNKINIELTSKKRFLQERCKEFDEQTTRGKIEDAYTTVKTLVNKELKECDRD